MKGYDINNDLKNKLLSEYNNEYGINFTKKKNLNYERYFRTKNNLINHEKMIKPK